MRMIVDKGQSYREIIRSISSEIRKIKSLKKFKKIKNKSARF